MRITGSMNRIYALIPQDNDSYAFRDMGRATQTPRPHDFLLPRRDGTDFPLVRRCTCCGDILDKWNTPLAGFKVANRNLDCGHTYDGVYVVSQRFQDACLQGKLSGLVFTALPDDHGFYALSASRVVKIDSQRRKVRFSKQCPRCKQYSEVTGSTPFFLPQGESIGGLECVRTDLEYACHDEKGFFLLCGEDAAAFLRGQQLKGLVVKEQPQ